MPFSLRGGENDAEMCLFVKDGDKERIKAAVAADPVLGLAKIMTVKKLKKNFSRFDDKRTLAGAYDLFLADDRILPYLKEHLGTKFFIKKKQPLAVRVSRKDVSNSVRAVFRRTALHTSTGVCSNVKIAHMGMPVDEIVANILVGMNNVAAHISKSWRGIQSINIKTADSVSLPIYNSLAELSKLPPVNKKQLATKRKLEQVEAAATEAPVKKTKKNNGQATAKKEAAPAKKEQTPKKATPVKEAAKKATPVKEETKASKKPAAKKEATPVKETTPKAAKKSAAKKDATPAKQETTPKAAAKKETKKATPVKKETSTPTKASPTAAANKATKRKSESTPEPAAKAAKKATTPQQTPPSGKKSKDKKKKPTKQ